MSQESSEGEELKQCALFNQLEKSRFSVLDGDRNKSGMPEDQESFTMMFEGFADIKTGTSLKQKGNFYFGEEALRVTTTEAHDIFDDEVWNASYSQP